MPNWELWNRSQKVQKDNWLLSKKREILIQNYQTMHNDSVSSWMIKCGSQENHLNISQVSFCTKMWLIFLMPKWHGNKWVDYSLVTQCLSYLCLFFQMEHLIWASTYNSSIDQHLMLSPLGISFGQPFWASHWRWSYATFPYMICLLVSPNVESMWVNMPHSSRLWQ